VGLSKPTGEAFPPVVVLGEGYEGCGESIMGGDMQWNLLEVDKCLGNLPVIGVVSGRETLVGPASVEGCESEGKCCEGGGPDSENDWCMVVRSIKNTDSLER